MFYPRPPVVAEHSDWLVFLWLPQLLGAQEEQLDGGAGSISSLTHVPLDRPGGT